MIQWASCKFDIYNESIRTFGDCVCFRCVVVPHNLKSFCLQNHLSLNQYLNQIRIWRNDPQAIDRLHLNCPLYYKDTDAYLHSFDSQHSRLHVLLTRLSINLLVSIFIILKGRQYHLVIQMDSSCPSGLFINIAKYPACLQINIKSASFLLNLLMQKQVLLKTMSYWLTP